MAYSNRFELKYIIDVRTFVRLKKDLDNFFIYDQNGNEEGKYIVSSLYYDSPNFDFYTEKVNGEKVRSKVRIRTYLDPKSKKENMNLEESGDKKTLLEIKKKYNQIIFKKKIFMSEIEARNFLQYPESFMAIISKVPSEDRKTVAELANLNERYKLRPVIVVQYIRQAFISKFFPKIRLTFDTNLKCGVKNFSIYDLNHKKNFLNPNLGIFEIKYDTILPLWISNLIKKYSLPLSPFSKYCSAIDNIKIRNEELINMMPLICDRGFLDGLVY